MDIQRSYIHSSASSGHYATGHGLRKSALISLADKDQHTPHVLQQEPIKIPLPQPVSKSSSAPSPSFIEIDKPATSNTLQQDGSKIMKLVNDAPHSQTATPSLTITSTYTPAMYLASRDKRKSSPAVLGLLRLGEEQEDKLSLHRNSIEAAMLLINFNRLQTKEPLLAFGNKETATTWKESKSVDSNSDKKVSLSWQDPALSATSTPRRRYSFDSNMSWEAMPERFLNEASLLQELKVKPIKIPSTTTTCSSSAISSPRIRSKTWYSESMEQDQIMQQQSYRKHIDGQAYQTPPDTVYHPIYPLHQPMRSNSQPYQQPPPPGYYAYSYPPASQHQYYYSSKLPLSSSTNIMEGSNNSNGMIMMYPYHPGYPPMVPVPAHLHPLHPVQHHRSYPLQAHLQQQSQVMTTSATAATAVKPKRKRRDLTEDDENADQVMPDHPDFPDMAERDVEAARNDVEARPRRQKLRYLGDMYTPQWVRYNGQSKEGLCDTCKPGKWLQLKNSAFWYHKQFFHGISSVSGTEFMKPMDTRWVDQDIVEGLCHQCQQWVSVSNVKRKNSVLWYRHAHKCHVYHKPKSGSPKRR